MLAEQLIVIGVGPNPEPQESVLRLVSYGSMMEAYSRRPVVTYLPETERWIARILLEPIESLMSEFSDVLW